MKHKIFIFDYREEKDGVNFGQWIENRLTKIQETYTIISTNVIPRLYFTHQDDRTEMKEASLLVIAKTTIE